jgi:eukaryotic-like serine/threonine-protein kinase
LYQLATGELPFGEPQTSGGLRQRLWMDPPPPRKLQPTTPPWLQEIILRCLEPEAAKRYPSAAHLAFDLRHPEHVIVTDRGNKTQSTGFITHLNRWLIAAGMFYKPSALPTQLLSEVPIVMVAVPQKDTQDATLYALRKTVENALGTRPGAKLACVTVISEGETHTTSDDRSETSVHRKYLSRLRQWAQPLDLTGHQASYHVLESGDVAQALVDYAAGNHVSVIVLGAATHGLALQRLVATIPIKVAMRAPCTVILVKQARPFALLNGNPAP